MGMIASRCSSDEALSEIASFGRDLFLRQPLDAGNDPAGGKRDVPRREAMPLGSSRIRTRRHHRFVIQQRLTLAHQHYVGLRRSAARLSSSATSTWPTISAG